MDKNKVISTREYLRLRNKFPSESNSYESWKEDRNLIINYNKDLLKRYPWLEPVNAFSGKRIIQCSGKNGEKGFWPGDPNKNPDYDYSYTVLDEMPRGWRLAFGDDMIEEINQELLKYDFVEDYRVIEIKEKWGGLRWYDGGTPVGKLSKDYQEVTRRGHESLKRTWGPDFLLKEDCSEHYISPFSKESEGKTQEEIDEYNKGAVHKYRLYKIEERCLIPSIINKYERESLRTCISCGDPAEWESQGRIAPYCSSCASKFLESNAKDGDRVPSIRECFDKINQED